MTSNKRIYVRNREKIFKGKGMRNSPRIALSHWTVSKWAWLRFMFCGPTGVGKTALCKTLSKTFFGTEAEVVLCRESTQSFCLNVSGHDDQIRHERVHGEAHSASAFLVREAILLTKCADDMCVMCHSRLMVRSPNWLEHHLGMSASWSFGDLFEEIRMNSCHLHLWSVRKTHFSIC